MLIFSGPIPAPERAPHMRVDWVLVFILAANFIALGAAAAGFWWMFGLIFS